VNRLKAFLASVLCLILLLTVLSGCGNNNPSATATPETVITTLPPAEREAYVMDNYKTGFAEPDAWYGFHAMRHDLGQNSPQNLINTLSTQGVQGVVGNVQWNSKYLQYAPAFKKLNQGIDAAIAKGMQVWLYDENGYPSGGAGTLTLDGNPEYEARGLVVLQQKGSGMTAATFTKPDDLEKITYAYAVDAQGKSIPATFTENSATFAGTEGDWTLYVACIKILQEGTAADLNGYASRPYVNLMDKDAIAKFIRVTYDAYYENIPDFENKIDAMFTDEPCLIEGYIGGTHTYAPASWVTGFEQRFQEMHGYDIMPYVHYLFTGDTVEARTVRVHYRQTVADLVGSSYFKQINDWCEAHGTELSGHINNEEKIYEHVAYYGNLFSTIKNMGYIGMDMLTSNLDTYMNGRWVMGPKYVGSIARVNGKSSTVMVEYCPVIDVPEGKLFNSFEEMRAVTNLLWFSGANYLNSYMQADTLEGRSEEYSDYIGRMGFLTSKAIHDARIGVYYPVETIQAYYKPLSSLQTFYDSDRNISPIEKSLKALNLKLWQNQMDYDFIDADSILNAGFRGNSMVIGGMELDVMIMDNAQVLPLAVLNKLKDFERIGGTVIWTGSAPEQGTAANEHAEIAAFGKTVTLSADPVKDAKAAVAENFKLTATRGDITNIYVSRNLLGDAPMYFIVNSNATAVTVNLSYEGAQGFDVYIPQTGEIKQMTGGELTVEGYSAVLAVVRK